MARSTENYVALLSVTAVLMRFGSLLGVFLTKLVDIHAFPLPDGDEVADVLILNLWNNTIIDFLKLNYDYVSRAATPQL